MEDISSIMCGIVGFFIEIGADSMAKDYIKSAHEDNCPDIHMTFYYMHTSINTGRGSEFTIKHNFTTSWV